MQKPRTITALITPFTDEYKLDLTGLELLIERQIAAGIEGLLLLGTTGEAAALSDSERNSAIQTAVKCIKGRVPLYVGTGTNSTETTVEQTQAAKKLGADGALIVTPYYSRPNEEGIVRHFERVSEKCSFPICLYHIPKRTGLALSQQLIARLLQLPNMFGIKESSGDFALIGELCARFADKRGKGVLWSGDDPLILPTMALGGYGVISVVGNLFPELLQQMVALAAEGDFAQARERFYVLYPMIGALFVESNPIPLKAAMEICGLPAGPCRLPLGPLEPSHRQLLQEQLTSLGAI